LISTNNNTIVLGIAGALNHDASVSIIQGSDIKFAGHAERYSKIKNDPLLNTELLRDALQYGTPDVIAWYENPWKKKTRQLYAGQYKTAFDMDELPKKYLQQFPELKDIPIEYQSHHYTHAASGYYTSGFHHAAIVVIDSIGEWETLTIWQGSGSTLSKMYTQRYPHSLGLFYSAMTQRLGLKANEDEYILMGMAAHGDASRKYKGKELYVQLKNAFDITGDTSSSWENKNTLSFGKNLHKGCNWLFPDLTTEQDLFDLAAATQHIYEMMFDRIIKLAKELYHGTNLVLMGGCALNCVANSNITDNYGFKNIWIMPNPGDSGSCIGVAQKYNNDWALDWKTPYLGYNIEGDYPVEKALETLLTGEICGIANGRAEFGPRALGNRTLTADPRGPTVKDKMNEIKHRQKFRPFAPMILEEDVHEYFEMPGNITQSPYMQFVAKCKFPKEFPAIVHVDNTSRVQTVNQLQHPELYQLLSSFKTETGCPMLVNTSLNIKGKPIVNDEQDAIDFSKHYGVKVFTSD
jgi:carbamoyltransferase